MDGRFTGCWTIAWRTIAPTPRRVPSVAGQVIPEPVCSRDDYEREILRPHLSRSSRRYDPEGVLRHEWLNARGAIARFDRNTIEIRVLDVQECPRPTSPSAPPSRPS